MFKNTSAALLVLIVSLSASAQFTEIIGGDVVQPSDIVANSTVALKYIQGNKAYPVCTGTLISSNLVLTAAHCLKDMNKKSLRVAFSIDVKTHLDPATMYKIENLTLHPLYNGKDQKNDVALILLSDAAPVPYKPVAVLSLSYKLNVGMPMLLAGYGIINDKTFQDTDALRRVTVPMAKILDTIIVTDQTQAKGACNGDSGGPAYLEKEGLLYVYGITRGPHEEAIDCHHFGEYTYASKFEKFIMDSAKAMKAEVPKFAHP